MTSYTAFHPHQFLEFYKLAEKLKTTLRHSWLSNGRQESVADHTWMMALLSLALLPHIKQPLNTQKILKMIILHDLAEALTSDLPIWQGQEDLLHKHQEEEEAMQKILAPLDEATRHELMTIWHEYEQRQTAEAKFVKAIDTLDVIVQHNVAPIDTWDDNDYLWQLSPLQDAFFDFDKILRKLKAEIDKWSIEKADEAGGMAKLDQEELKKKQHHS